MNRKLKIVVLATSAPHFPLESARRSRIRCMKLLNETSYLEYEFLESKEVITDTTSFGRELAQLKGKGPDILILIQGAFTWDNITTYLYEYFGKLPTIIWALPEDIFIKDKLGTNSLCGAIMNNAALRKLGEHVLFCYSGPQEDETKERIDRAIKTVACAARIRNAKYGMVGYRPIGFYNSTFDELDIRRVFGIETIYYDLSTLFEDMKRIPKRSLEEEIRSIRRLGKIGEADPESLSVGARTYIALKRFAEKEAVDFLSIQCWPEMMNRGMNPCLTLGRLIEEKHIAGCESDFGGALSLAIAHWLSGNVPWLADIVDLNKRNGSFYFWHCGAASRSLSYNKEAPIINKQFRGLGRCNTLEFLLKEGPVTIFRFGITNGGYRIFAFKGTAVRPAPRIRGNLSEVIVSPGPESLLDKIIGLGVEHHYAIVYGDYIDQLRDLSGLLKIDFYHA